MTTTLSTCGNCGKETARPQDCDCFTITRYQVIDTQTGYIQSEHSTSTRAHRKADKLDSIYGAIRYTVKAVTR